MALNLPSLVDMGVQLPAGAAQWQLLAIGANGQIRLFDRTEIPGMVVAQGSAQLSGGTVTVNTALIGPTVGVFAFHQNVSGTPGALRTSARVNGVSFTITSSSGTDASTIAWMLVNG